MAVPVVVQVDELINELRVLLQRLDSVLDNPLPQTAASEAEAARQQILNLLEDFLDSVEVDEALHEAGGARVSWDEFQPELDKRQG